MNQRLLATLIVGAALFLWPVERAAADSIAGGGVSSSGSQPWIGRHNNTPRVTLLPVGGVFTPPSSFGNYWILNNAASQSVACPPDIADGDSMEIHIQQGSGAPFSPSLSFNSCYGWSGGQPTWSSAANQVDYAFCTSVSPPDVTGINFVCNSLLNASLPAGNGVCGAANGAVQSTAPPPPPLCSVGTASSVSGTGPWTWTCAGSGGGSTASCSASPTTPVATVWSSTHKSAVFTLDGTSRVATQGSSAVQHNPVYGATTVTSGKWYTQVIITSGNISNSGVGIGNASAAITGDYYPGSDANSAGWYGWGGTNISGITVPTYSSGQPLCIAFDVPNKLIWFSPANSANWNSGGASGNFPSSGAGGGSFSYMAAGAISVAGQTAGTGDTATLAATPCPGLAGLSGFSPL